MLPKWCSGKESAWQCRRCRRRGFDPWVGKIPWRRKWQPTPVFLPGESHGQRNLVGCSPWAHKNSQTPLRDGALTHVTITGNKEGKIKNTSPGKERKVSTKIAAYIWKVFPKGIDCFPAANVIAQCSWVSGVEAIVFKEDQSLSFGSGSLLL